MNVSDDEKPRSLRSCCRFTYIWARCRASDECLRRQRQSVYITFSQGGSRRWSWRQINASPKSPSEAGALKKYTTWNLRPCENERHKLMPLIAFFTAVHISIVLFQCHVAQCLASWGHAPLPPPQIRPCVQQFDW